VWNTSFYKNKRRIEFRKPKIDVINKDKSHVQVDWDFYMGIDVDVDGDDELLRLEAKTRQIFYKYGQRLVVNAGEWLESHSRDERHLPSHDGLDHSLYLIAAGSVEGVVHEVAQTDGAIHHPLGRSAIEACSLGKGSVSGDCAAGDCSRVPNACMMGAGTVVGASGFLSNAHSIKYRARCRSEVFRLLPTLDHSLALPQSRIGGLQRQGDDLSVEHVPASEMPDFYRGLSIVLGTRLSRIRIDAVRLGRLKALNDRQTVLADSDESEKLRSGCLSMFGLPMNEKLLTRAKCSCVYPEKDKAVRLRMIIMVNYIILDPDFFGPDISSASEIWSLRQLHSVSPGEDDANTTLQMTLLGERVHGLDIAANVVEYKFTFNDSLKTRLIYHHISSMCKKAEETRARERQRPFETPVMSSLLETCSLVHRIKKGDVLREASSKSSLFLVCSGEIRLKVKDGDVFRIVREGALFGEINFSLNCTAGHYICIANAHTILLEISHPQLHRALEHDQKLSAQFFFIFCQAIEKEIRETLEETFPGALHNTLPLCFAACALVRVCLVAVSARSFFVSCPPGVCVALRVSALALPCLALFLLCLRILIQRKTPPRGGFLFTMFPHQEP